MTILFLAWLAVFVTLYAFLVRLVPLSREPMARAADRRLLRFLCLVWPVTCVTAVCIGLLLACEYLAGARRERAS